MIQNHPEFCEVIRQRHDALVTAFPDEPINQARVDAARELASNPNYGEGA